MRNLYLLTQPDTVSGRSCDPENAHTFQPRPNLKTSKNGGAFRVATAGPLPAPARIPFRLQRYETTRFIISTTIPFFGKGACFFGFSRKTDHIFRETLFFRGTLPKNSTNFSGKSDFPYFLQTRPEPRKFRTPAPTTGTETDHSSGIGGQRIGSSFRARADTAGCSRHSPTEGADKTGSLTAKKQGIRRGIPRF